MEGNERGKAWWSSEREREGNGGSNGSDAAASSDTEHVAVVDADDDDCGEGNEWMIDEMGGDKTVR